MNSRNSIGDRATPSQRRILVAGALLIAVALLLPPWSRPNGAFSGFKLLFLPLITRVPDRVNSSLLFLELAAIAIATCFLFVAVRHVELPSFGRLAKVISALLGIAALDLFAWFIWPRWYSEIDGIRTHRLTSVRHVWSQAARAWITESEFDKQSRATAGPVLDELREIRIARKPSDIDWVYLYNPTHWDLPYGHTKLKVELYQEEDKQMLLLKITERDIAIEPGLNNIYMGDVQRFSGSSSLVQKIKIVASMASPTDANDHAELYWSPRYRWIISVLVNEARMRMVTAPD
jgi:hypothetical protein